MKILFWLTLVVLCGLAACDNNSNQQTGVGDDTNDNSLITIGDIPKPAQAAMYQTIFDYNQCMMGGRLSANQQGQHAQQAANDIMNACETHLDSVEELLIANQVNESLVVGMTKKLRSRAARKLMTQSMNAMAAQAAAAQAAKQMQAE